MRGIIRYGPDPVVAIVDSARAGETHEGIPVVGTRGGRAPFEPTTALVGVATQGGRFPPAWRALLRRRSRRASTSRTGCTSSSPTIPSSTELAGEHGVELRDLRRPPGGLNVPTGANLEVDAQIVLTVGSDCAIGKKTVARARPRRAARGLDSVFVPTGQTGIAIAGWGIAVDAVVATSWRAPPSSSSSRAPSGRAAALGRRQGSIVHPLYSGVTLGLIHGSAPHAYVLCHRAGSTEIEGCPGHPIPPLAEAGRAARAHLARAGGGRGWRPSPSTRAGSRRRRPRAAARLRRPRQA